MRRFSSHATIACAISVVVACGGAAVNPSVVATGVWGGNDVTMTVAQDATHVEFDCAHGDVPAAIDVDGRGRFDAVGTFVREHGGPIQLGETPESHPASYGGTVSGSSMALTVRLMDTGEQIGAFTLTRGTPGRVVKCL